MIKTIGLHRYLVKYIYSTLSHVVAVCFFILLLAVPSAVSVQLSLSLSREACAVVPILHLYKTGQNSMLDAI